MSHSSLSTYRPGLYKLCLCTALCLRNLGNCALTSNERKSSQRFLRGCSQVITLSLNRVRFSISFLNQLVKFFVTIFYLHLSFLFFILEIIIYFFSSPNYENLQKKKKIKVYMLLSSDWECKRWEPGSQWPLSVRLQVNTDIWKEAPPALCSCLQRCCGSSHAISHHTPGALGHQDDTDVFWVWALWIFFFFFSFFCPPARKRNFQFISKKLIGQ